VLYGIGVNASVGVVQLPRLRFTKNSFRTFPFMGNVARLSSGSNAVAFAETINSINIVSCILWLGHIHLSFHFEAAHKKLHIKFLWRNKLVSLQCFKAK